MTKDKFIIKYVEALRKNEASVFVGAGFSYDATKKDWKELVKPYALKLDAEFLLDNQSNYPFLMQAYVNKYGNIETLKEDIAKNFINSEISDKHITLAKLPIVKYMTTDKVKIFCTSLVKKLCTI